MLLRTAAFSVLQKLLRPVIGIGCLDVQNAAAAGAATLKAATATVAAAVTLTASDLIAGGKTALLSCPRQVRFTTAGATAADAPATATITGITLLGPATEVVTLAQTATTADGVYFWTRIDSIAYPAADGTGATIAIGFTAALGLPAKLKGRGASSLVVPTIREFVTGVSPSAAVQSGTSTLVAGTIEVTGVTLTASSKILLTMRDPGAGALTDFAGLDAPVATRDTALSKFVVNAIQGADKAVLTTAISTFDWAVVEGAGSGLTGALTAAATHKPYGSYTPGANAVPDATRDHIVFFEVDA